MTEQTPLDTAHAAMLASNDQPAARLRFFERLADSELFLLLESEADNDHLDPLLMETGDGCYVIAFDRQERLAEFTGIPSPYAALSGRVLVAMLARQGIGIAINPEVATSAWLIPNDAVDWLAKTLSHAPSKIEAIPDQVSKPANLPKSLISALDTKLASAGGLAGSAWLTGITYKDGRQGYLLAFVGAHSGSEDALAKAVNEALIFSDAEVSDFDVAFFAPNDPVLDRFASVGLRFDLPQPKAPAASKPRRPGGDPNTPPVLR